MRIFVCHSTLDSEFVIQVASLLKPNCEEVFYYETQQSPDHGFLTTISKALQRCDCFLVFVGGQFSKWQVDEVSMARKKGMNVCTALIRQPDGSDPESPTELKLAFGARPEVNVDPNAADAAAQTALKIMRAFGIPGVLDGLPFDPNLFSYEKDVIDFYTRMIALGQQQPPPLALPDLEVDPQNVLGLDKISEIRQKLLNGCPAEWPKVPYWSEDGVSAPPDASYVVAAALSKHHEPVESNCMVRNKLFFPEARARKTSELSNVFNNVAILVAGGIAPGINAVIDGIVQRHSLDARERGYNVVIHGIKNGVGSINFNKDPGFILDAAFVPLTPNITAIHAREGGSIIGTSRVDQLIQNKALLGRVVNALLVREIELLYVIGGDGSMKLAHALWNCANRDNANHRPLKNLSVVAVPKTMDNDILWVWQSFGFLSAVEKAREILTILDTEVKSNPRLCLLQLFGSDSGFVVSHTVAASGSDQCDAALIPEVKFSLRDLARYLRRRMYERKSADPSVIVPSGFVVMAETAIPTDAICYVDDKDHIPEDLLPDWEFIKQHIRLDRQYLGNMSTTINLSDEEKEAIYEFHRMRRQNRRIQGQTSDALRRAGLKIVSRGLQELISLPDPKFGAFPQPDWEKLRIVTNEPRHVLRSIAPTCSDIIMGQRLGTLAVDNAMVGYTDFMISQWLTEFVLVPLPLVVLGRKRIPMGGMFWKSVLAKTGQPEDLDESVGPLPRNEGAL